MTIATGRILRPIVETVAEEMISETDRITLLEYARLLKKGLWDLMPIEAQPVITDHKAFYPLRGDGVTRYARPAPKTKRYGRWCDI